MLSCCMERVLLQARVMNGRRGCRNLRSADTTLRASALLALTKLMCLDASFCDNNLQLIFTLLQNRCRSYTPLNATLMHC